MGRDPYTYWKLKGKAERCEKYKIAANQSWTVNTRK